MISWRFLLILFLAGFLIFQEACKKEQDEELPAISLVSPANCDSTLQGTFINFKATFTDNDELARYAIDIHQNFDHDSYATTDQGCNFGPDQTPFNPFKYGIVDEIPPGLKSYTAELNILVPESTDSGDYFMVVYAQDKRGLQKWYSISLKFYNNDR